VKQTAEGKMKVLFSKHSFPPIEVVVPILEKAGRGEQELSAQVYDTEVKLIDGLKEILGLQGRDIKTLAQIFGILMTHDRQKFEPVELSESKFSVAILDCPMVHVGKNISVNVKSKFCDLMCSTSLKALRDTVLGHGSYTCSWDKALVKGSGRCNVVWELVR
jgi:hypothetical protein